MGPRTGVAVLALLLGAGAAEASGHTSSPASDAAREARRPDIRITTSRIRSQRVEIRGVLDIHGADPRVACRGIVRVRVRGVGRPRNLGLGPDCRFASVIPGARPGTNSLYVLVRFLGNDVLKPQEVAIRARTAAFEPRRSTVSSLAMRGKHDSHPPHARSG